MSYREILVYTGTGDLAHRMCGYAAELASSLKARLAGVVVEADFVDLSQMDRAILDRERHAAVEALIKQLRDRHDFALRAGDVFREAAEKLGVPHDTIFKTCVPADIPGIVTELARLYDCSILPAVEEYDGLQVAVVEEVLFGSGRPLIVLPVKEERQSNIVCVAWDGSRPATRAVHDALPLLKQAARVEVVTITEEKPLDRLPTGHDMARHLKVHDVDAHYGEVRFDGKPVGEQIMHEALRFNADLLVMGAYGHPRLKEIVFGGATRTILKGPTLPVFLSH